MTDIIRGVGHVYCVECAEMKTEIVEVVIKLHEKYDLVVKEYTERYWVKGVPGTFTSKRCTAEKIPPTRH